MIILQVFYFEEPVDCSGETKLSGTVEMIRQEKNKRLYNLKVVSSTDDGAPITAIYEIP